MSDEQRAFHMVATWDEAEEIIGSRSAVWVAECGCRTGNENGCKRSEAEVCLFFTTEFTEGSARQIALADVEALVARHRRLLVARPFRSQTEPDGIGGLCVCCDDCCAYFLDPTMPCDRGSRVQETDKATCEDCGTCAEVCYFRVRAIADGKLTLAPENCYGCGLCAEVCPTGSARMVERGQRHPETP